MRALILIAGAALALGGCGNNNRKGNDQNVNENLTAENIVSNDVTAIDAVTGDAANMAADVDMNFGNLGNDSGTAASNSPVAGPAPRKAVPKTAPQPETTTANAASNAE